MIKDRRPVLGWLTLLGMTPWLKAHKRENPVKDKREVHLSNPATLSKPNGYSHIAKVSSDFRQPQLPVSIKIGNTTATIQKIEAVPGNVAGLLRITALVPESVAPGPAVPLILTVGSSSSPAGVTVAVK